MKDIPVIYDDDNILIVNKPYGIAVQGGEGVTVTIIDILERQTGIKIYPVHRLDKDTAGILVVARSSRAASEYSRYIAGGSLEKAYKAVCFGHPGDNSGIITVPAGRSGEEKPAETSWMLERTGNGCSLLSLRLGTGRMHQIRIHLASIGCPIVADDKYGDFPQNRRVRSEFKVRKLQLAACDLSLPVGNSVKHFSIGLPEHMVECLNALGIPHPA
jgi:23S rRNA pseudouridine955/2504/2580 synthase